MEIPFPRQPWTHYANNGSEFVLFLLAFIIPIVRTSGAKIGHILIRKEPDIKNIEGSPGAAR